MAGFDFNLRYCLRLFSGVKVLRPRQNDPIAVMQNPVKRKYKILLMIGIPVVIAGVAVYEATRHDSPAQTMQKIGLPALPPSAEITSRTVENFFNFGFYVRVGVAAADFAQYEQNFSNVSVMPKSSEEAEQVSSIYFRNEIGTGQKQVLVVRPQDLETHRGGVDYSKEVIFTDDSKMPWWTPWEISHGHAYRRTNKDGTINIFFDDDRHLIFIEFYDS